MALEMKELQEVVVGLGFQEEEEEVELGLQEGLGFQEEVVELEFQVEVVELGLQKVVVELEFQEEEEVELVFQRAMVEL